MTERLKSLALALLFIPMGIGILILTVDSVRRGELPGRSQKFASKPRPKKPLKLSESPVRFTGESLAFGFLGLLFFGVGGRFLIVGVTSEETLERWRSKIKQSWRGKAGDSV